MGGSCFLQKRHPSCGGLILEIKHHLPLRIPAKLITSNGKNPKWKKDWHKFLPFALCTYRASVRTSMGATLYSLVYSMEAVLPAKVEIPSLRILSQTMLSEAEWAHSRYEQLNMIDKKCITAMCHGQLYQRCVERAFNKKVRPRVFEEGNLVLKKRN